MRYRFRTMEHKDALLMNLETVTTQVNVFDLHVMFLSAARTSAWVTEASNLGQDDDAGEKCT
jgi:hypothetical protein